MYKFLDLRDGQIVSGYGEHVWEIGQEYSVTGEITICEKGFHASETVSHAFSYVAGEVLAIVDGSGDNASHTDKSVWRGMKIVKAYKWSKNDSVALAIYSAELVLEHYERAYPEDSRPRKAIEAARIVLNAEPTADGAARAAARAAAWAADGAARAAARAAAWAADGAARDAAWAAAWAADGAARDAAWASARAAQAAARAAQAAARAVGVAAGAVGVAGEAAWAASLAVGAARDAIFDKIDQWMVARIPALEEIQ